MLDVHTRGNLKARFYPGADDTVLGPVLKTLDHNLRPNSRVLDAGCGEGTWILREYHDRVGLLVGADVKAPENPIINDFVVAGLENLPFADATFDLVLSYYVTEHLRQPEKAFRELARVMVDGGILIVKTPCIAAPAFLLSRWAPLCWHRAFKRTVLGTKESDVFPTYYRCNTAGKLDQTLKAAGFRKEKLATVEQIYEYLAINRVLYTAGLLMSRILQAVPLARPFRSQLIGIYRKENQTNKPGGRRRDGNRKLQLK